MFACCEFCYEKYIEPSGEIDWVILYKLQLNNPVVLKVGEKRPVCMCECHIKGCNCLH